MYERRFKVSMLPNSSPFSKFLFRLLHRLIKLKEIRNTVYFFVYCFIFPKLVTLISQIMVDKVLRTIKEDNNSIVCKMYANQ